MSASAAAEAASRRGRPAGIAGATLARAERILEQARQGIATAAIAEAEGLSARRVLQLVDLAGGGGREDEDEEADYDVKPLSRRVLLDRAWASLESPTFRVVGPAASLLWMKVVLMIGATGEGTSIAFGRGNAFRDRGEMVSALGNATDADLNDLLDRGLLDDRQDGAIGMPAGHKLIPRVRRSRRRPHGRAATPEHGPALAAARPAPPATALRQAPLPPMAMRTRGNFASDQGILLPNRGSEIGNLNPPIGSENAGGSEILMPAASRAPTLTHPLTSLTSQEDKGTSEGVSVESGTRAGIGSENPPIGNLIPPDEPPIGNFNPGEIGNLIPPPPDGGELVDELLRLGGHLGRAARKDIRLVDKWLDDGASPELLVRVVKEVMSRAQPPERPALSYFTGAIAAATAAAREPHRRAALSVVPADSPVEADRGGLSPRLQAPWDAWSQDKGCPFPPAPNALEKAAAKGLQGHVDRWLDAWAAWDAARRPGSVKPPDFTLLDRDPTEFAARLAELEEMLTSPG